MNLIVTSRAIDDLVLVDCTVHGIEAFNISLSFIRALRIRLMIGTFC